MIGRLRGFLKIFYLGFEIFKMFFFSLSEGTLSGTVLGLALLPWD